METNEAQPLTACPSWCVKHNTDDDESGNYEWHDGEEFTVRCSEVSYDGKPYTAHARLTQWVENGVPDPIRVEVDNSGSAHLALDAALSLADAICKLVDQAERATAAGDLVR